jgi:hypothetical protein
MAALKMMARYFPVRSLSRPTGLERIRRSVPRSFSPDTASNPRRITYRLKTILMMKAQSRSGISGILKLRGPDDMAEIVCFGLK